ncbi:hypothetical protein Tco_1403786 [Tanacetum coccineum]
MMTVRKRVGPLPTHRLAVRHSVDYSSSDHFSSNDSSRDSSSSSSSDTSSDSSADALSDSASNHSLPASSSGMRSSHHLCSLVPIIHRSSAAIFERPSHSSSPVSPSRKRSRSPAAYTTTDLKGCSEDSFEPYIPREAGLGVGVEDESSEPSRFRGIDLEADALRATGIDARVLVEAVDQEEVEASARGPVEVRIDRVTHPVITDDISEPAQEEVVEVTYETLGDLVQRFHDHTEEIPVHRVQAIECVQRDQGYKIVATGQQSADMLERIKELERDNRRLRDMMDVV